jgi:hypothetical protein
VLSKDAWAAWLGVLIAVSTYGIVSGKGPDYWITMTIAMPLLWIVDKLYARRDRKKGKK